MKALRNYSLLLICTMAALFISGCQPSDNKDFTIERSYSYTIRASISGNSFNGEGPTYFELKPKGLRRMKFRQLPAKPDATMYAYRLTSQYEYNEQLNKSELVSADTVEVAVTKLQADSLFNLAKTVFKSVSISNIDTIYSETKTTYSQTDDVSGTVKFESRYGVIEIQTGSLHSSDNRQAAPFLALWNGFEVLFPEKRKSK